MSRRLLDGKLPERKPGSNKGRRAILDLTPELMDQICAPLIIGAPIDTAAALRGVSYDTLRSWVIKGNTDPNSIYGVLLKRIAQSVAEWEARDLSVIEKHAQGAPPEYYMEIVKDEHGNVMYDKNGDRIMQVAKDNEGRPIIKRPGIKSDVKAAMWRLERRKPKYWERKIQIEDAAGVLSFDNKKPETKEAMSFDEKVAQAMKKFEDEY